MSWTELLDEANLNRWGEPTGDWRLAGSVAVDPDDETRLVAGDGDDRILINGDDGNTVDIHSREAFGDIELELEFFIPARSNSGVYLQSRYEVQILDSWGVEEPTYADCGGIYERWGDDGGYEGTAPRINASRPPGAWQHYVIRFRAPRFDADGNKTDNAHFVQVVHNGIVIHEHVDVTGPTRASTYEDEAPTGPLMLQGDHGPVAYRNIRLRPLEEA